MANLTLSGYLATAVSIAWASGQTLDSLTDNEYTDASDEVDNSTNKYRLADVYVHLASAAFTGADSGIEVYVILTVDGTTYGTWTGNGTTDEQENNAWLVGFIPTTGSTAAQEMVLRDVPLPNGKYKWGFRSRLNVSAAASGNTAVFRPHSVAA